MTKRAIACCLAVFVVVAALAARRTVCEGFLPENDMKIPVDGFRAQSGLSESQFNGVLDKVERVYGPVLKAQGATLNVKRLWTDATVNASATQSMLGNTWTINMYGGLARHPSVTEEGFALVACHELGHHIGGAPKLRKGLARIGLGRWATNEGGSDYFATLKCMRRLGLTPSASLDPAAVAACDSVHRDPQARAECYIGAAAGQSVAGMFQSFRAGLPPVSFTKPDPAIVKEHYDRHPAPQCRMDTYFQGALCTRSVSDAVSVKDVNAGACTRKNGHMAGLRPRCWYMPPKDEPAGPTVASVFAPKQVERFASKLSNMSVSFE